MTVQIPKVVIRTEQSVLHCGDKRRKQYRAVLRGSKCKLWMCKFEASVLKGQGFIYYTDDNSWDDTSIYSRPLTPRIKALPETLNNRGRNTALQNIHGNVCRRYGNSYSYCYKFRNDSFRNQLEEFGYQCCNCQCNRNHYSEAPGTATISCSGNNAKGIKASCKITVKLKQTTGLKVSYSAYNKIK